MYPPSVRLALVEQLEAEHIFRDLTFAAFEYWLPFAREAAGLTAAVEPDPDLRNAPSLTQELWELALDALVVYGGGLLVGRAIFRAFDALNVPLPPAIEERRSGAGTLRAGDSTIRDRARDLLQPDRAKLAALARKIVARVFGVDVAEIEALDRRLAQVPVIRDLQSRYLAAVRNRMVNTPESSFRVIAREIDEAIAKGENPNQAMADRVREKLRTEGLQDWHKRAETVARTESAGAISYATLEAGRAANAIFDEVLHKCWSSTIDGRTRHSHFAADGQRVDMDAEFKVGSSSLAFPGDPSGPAHEIINCRCRSFLLAEDEPLPAEIDRRAAEGVVRARDDPDGVGRVEVRAAAPPVWEYVISAAAAREYGAKLLEQFIANRRERVVGAKFTAVIAVLGEPTDDRRMLATGIDLRFRDFPLPVMWTKQTGYGHEDAYTVGVMEGAKVEGSKVTAYGYMLDTAEADEATEQIRHGVTGPSVDLADADWMLTDVDGNEITEEVMARLWGEMPGTEDDELPKVYETVTAAVLMGFTLVATPAFGTTTIELVDDETDEDETDEQDEDDEHVESDIYAAAMSRRASLYAAGGIVEKSHPAEFFTDPKFTGPTPVHMSEDGRISGHLACFGTCHIGITDRCVTVPRSAAEYAHFHTSPPLLTDKGRLAVGRLTVGTGHAHARANHRVAAEHYDNTGTCFALVRAGEDEFGVWISGVAAPGATTEQIAAGIAAPLSGDWRTIGGNLELVAALAVNTPGFPILASGSTDAFGLPLSLVASLSPRFAATADLPVADDRDHEWDAAGAQTRLIEHCDGQDDDCWRVAYLVPGDDPSSSKFPVADVIDGVVTIVPNAVTAAASRASSAKDVDVDKLEAAICAVYAKVAKVHEDFPACPFADEEESDDEPAAEQINAAAVAKLVAREMRAAARREIAARSIVASVGEHRRAQARRIIEASKG